jgi:hypothetical protein
MPGSFSDRMPDSPASGTQLRPGPAFYIVLVSAIVLFTAEIWISVLGVLWALAGFLSLDLTGAAIVAVLIVPGAAFATWKLAAMTFESERDLLAAPPEDG